DMRFRDARWKWAASNGDGDLVREDLKTLALAQPENLYWATNLVRLVRAEDGDAAAEAVFAELIAATPDPFQLELLLSKYRVEMGRREDAAAFLTELAEREGQSEANANTARIALARLLISEGRIEEAYALVDAVEAKDAANTEALLLQANRLVESGALDAAVQKIRLGLNQAPDDVRLLRLAANAQELAGNVDLANDRFARAVRTVDYETSTVEEYVRFLTRVGRHTAVEIVLSEAIARRPDDARLYDVLGFSRVQRGDWPGASEAARTLRRLNPDRAQQLLAAILIGQERFDEGASLLRDLPENEALRATSINALVQTYIQGGQMPEAVDFLESMLAENPDNLQALGLRGNLHLLAGEFE
ncbi:MAG: tetratricopeptide repeat protein, partial [Pseudomonadota bacterium]